jgi:MFS superfamily sulfate permease-like transporter
MIDFSKLRRLWRAHLGEFWLATGALAGVVIIDVLPGVLIGVALSFMLLIRRLDHPTIEVLGRTPDGTAYADVATNPDARAVPGVLVYAFRAPLVFANAEIFTDDLTTRSNGSLRPDTVILDCDGMAEVDTTGADALRQLHDDAGHTRTALAARPGQQRRRRLPAPRPDPRDPQRGRDLPDRPRGRRSRPIRPRHDGRRHPGMTGDRPSTTIERRPR